jgi:cytidylate kinase
MNNNVINVAIDGPGGAGKSTSARAAAKELGYIYVDTGALYRAVGVNALRNNVDTKDFSAVAASIKGISVDLVFENGEQKVLLDGESRVRTIELLHACEIESLNGLMREPGEIDDVLAGEVLRQLGSFPREPRGI